MQIKIVDLDERKYYNCNLIKLSESLVAQKSIYCTNLGLCVAHNIELPSFISSYDELKNIHNFDVLFILGLGSGRNGGNAYILNSHFNSYKDKVINLYEYDFFCIQGEFKVTEADFTMPQVVKALKENRVSYILFGKSSGVS